MAKQTSKIIVFAGLMGFLFVSFIGCASVIANNTPTQSQPLPDSPGTGVRFKCPANGVTENVYYCALKRFPSGGSNYLSLPGNNYVTVVLTNSTLKTYQFYPTSKYRLVCCDVTTSTPTFICTAPCALPAGQTNMCFVGASNRRMTYNVYFLCPTPSSRDWTGVYLMITTNPPATQ